MSSDLSSVKMYSVTTRAAASDPGPYHHGNLREAMLDKATALARAGGPEAVVLREVARQAGVSSAAAYHHFEGREELIQEVKNRALAVLAGKMRAAAEDSPAGTPRSGTTAADAARQRLRALA